MTDIVERLRDGGETCGIDRCSVRDAASGCTCAIAADEIERLREEIDFLRACCSGMAKVIDTTMKDMAK